MISTVKKSKAFTAIYVLCFFLLFLFFRNSEIAVEHMKRGLSICFDTLIPSLFPFMVISELLVSSGACESISRFMKRPMEVIFGVSGECASALLLGIACGFPVGAKMAASLYSRGDISRRDCEHLLSFCNFPSAPFLIFAVGDGMFGSRKAGIIIYCTVLIAGLLCGILFREKGSQRSMDRHSHSITPSNKILSVFASSVVSAASSVIPVCAFVCFFTCIVGCISSLFCADTNSFLQAILFSFFELTSGCAACSAIGEPRIGIILAAATGGWSGLSVFLQIYSLTRTDGEELSLLPYLKAKTISAAMCAALSALIIFLFPSLTDGINAAEDAFSAVKTYPASFTLTVNIIFALTLLICLYKLLDRRRKI